MMNDAIPLVKNVVQWRRNWSRHFSSCGATGLLCFAHFASAIEPAASVLLTVISAQQGRSELDVTEAALIEKLAAVLPDPINRDHFNHSDIELRLNGVRVGGYELVVSDTNLVQDGRFEMDKQHSPWRGMNREGYSLKAMPEKPGMAFIAECAKVQNIRLAQPMTLVKDQLYLLTYSAFSDVQRGDVAVQLDDPAKSVYPTLSNSYRPMMHRQREWERRSVVFRADIEKPELRVGTAFVGRAAVADVSLRAARWRLVADLAKGRHELTLTYVPRMGRRLTPPPNEPAADAKLPIALTRIGKAELLHANDTGVALHTPSGDAWTLPSDWPLRTDRLASSRPTKPAARHEVTIAKGMDATVLLALDFGGKTIALESITSELPIKISALRLASIPTHSYGSFDETIYRQLDPMVPVNDALVPFDHDQPTVLALTIQCTASTPSGTHEGDATLHFNGFDLNVPLSVRVLPVTVDSIKHFSTVFGLHPPSYAAQKQGSITENGVSVAAFHGYDPTKHEPLIQLSRDYVQRLLDFHVQSQSPAAEAGFTYHVEDVPDAAPKLTAWDFTEYDRSLENFFAHGGQDLFIAATNGDVMQQLTLANGHTYSFKPAPANAPRWHQLADDKYWNLVGRYIEGITAHLAEKGWLHRPCILVDETDPENYAMIRRYAEAMRAQPHAREVRLVNTHYHSAMYSKRLSGKAEGPLMLEGVLNVFIPENNDHADCWPTAGVWPRDRGALPTHWVYYTETDHLDLPHAGLSTSLMPLKCRWLGASGAYTWASVIWSMPFARTAIEDFGGGAAGPVMNPWLNANYQHGQGLLSFFYPPDPRGVSAEPTLKLTPSYRLALLRDGLQDNALMEIIKSGKDDSGKPVAVPVEMIRKLQSQLDETFINPTQWRVSRPHHEAWRQGVYSAIAMP